MARWPEPGHVKTRLCPPLTPARAADLARAFLLDRVESLTAAAPSLLGGVAFTPRHRAADFRSLLPGVPLHPQCDGDLGARLAHAMRAGLEAGLPATLLVGADTPLLAAETLATLADGLVRREFDVGLVPAPDGGYNAIGLSRMHPSLFEGIPWSGPEVLARTIHEAEALGLRVHLAPPCPDCDTPEDLRRLVARMRDDTVSFRALAPRTALLLEEGGDLLAGERSRRLDGTVPRRLVEGPAPSQAE